MSDTKMQAEAVKIELRTLEQYLIAGSADELPKELRDAALNDYGVDLSENQPSDVVSAWLSDNLGVRTVYDMAGDYVHGYQICVAVGGPNVWIHFDNSEWATIKVTWWGEKVETEVHVPNLRNLVFEMFDAVRFV